jgi:hypothetical protein
MDSVGSCDRTSSESAALSRRSAVLRETGEGVISISVFTDQAGAEESTRRAADWVQQTLAGFFTGPPAVTTGSVWLHDGGGEVSGTPVP